MTVSIGHKKGGKKNIVDTVLFIRDNVHSLR